MITTLSFDSKFQSGLLFLLVSNVDFFNLVVEELEPQHFSAGEGYIKLYKLIKKWYSQSKAHPTLKIVKNILIKLKDMGQLSEPEMYGLSTLLESGQTLNHSEYEYIKEHVFDFLRKQTVALAFAESISFFDVNDYDRMYDTMSKAYKKAFGVGESLGIDYLTHSVSDRYMEAPRKGVWSTGFDKFDSYLAGGLAENECYSVLSPSGRGKCMGIDTPVLMVDGSIKMIQNVLVDDELMGPDGKARKVLSTTSGKDNLYKVTPKKGTPYIVNSVHLLSLKATRLSHGLILADGVRIKQGTNGTVFVEAKTLFDSNTTVKHCLKGWRPTAVSFEKEHTNHPIPPYILGVWLGDGTSVKPEITQLDNEVVVEFKKYAESIGAIVSKYDINRGCCPMWSIKGDSSFRTELKSTSLWNNKHIPNSYKMSSIQDRLELLAGLLDTDGSLHYEGYDFVQKNKQLAEDVVFIARSLGLAANISECKKSIKSINFTGTYYRVTISGDCDKIPVRIAYKKAAPRKQKKNHLVTGITIEKAGYGDYYGFELDGDKQYLLGDWQVTHNTALLCNLAVSALRAKKKTLFITLEMEDLVISQRVDSILMGFSAKEIQENPELQIDLERKIKNLKAPNFTVKRFPRGATTTNQIENYIDRYCDEIGKPDVVIVDWLGCLKMTGGKDTKMHELMGEAANELVNMSRKYVCSLITAQQTNRSAVGNDEFGYGAVSESFSSLFGMDGVFGLGASDKAKDAGRRTLSMLKNRNGPDSVSVKLMGDRPGDPVTFKFQEVPDEEEEKDLLNDPSTF